MNARMKAAAVCLAVLMGWPVAGWPMEAPVPAFYFLPLVRTAGLAGQDSLVRIINRSDYSDRVKITAIDDTGRRFGPEHLHLGAWEAVNIDSFELERGDGIADRWRWPIGVGDGVGNWRLELETALEIEPLVYVRSDGRLMPMNAFAPMSGGSHWVPFFNPGSNTSKESRLRIINVGRTAADVTVSGRDDGGVARGTVRLTLEAGAARTLSARALEEGGEGLDGSLGDGDGKWRLNVQSDSDIRVMSLLTPRVGGLANLSMSPWSVDERVPSPAGNKHGCVTGRVVDLGDGSCPSGRKHYSFEITNSCAFAVNVRWQYKRGMGRTWAAERIRPGRALNRAESCKLGPASDYRFCAYSSDEYYEDGRCFRHPVDWQHVPAVPVVR